ncbi:MAG: hypothetical protein ACT4O9_07915 [Blastocatellia bacterium]
MYRRPKFLEVLIAIRQEMAREADFDTDLFAEMVRSGRSIPKTATHSLTDAVSDTPARRNGSTAKPRSVR